MSHRRSDERIRVGILVAYPAVECLQTRRGGRSFRAPLAASAALPKSIDHTSLCVAAPCSPPTAKSDRLLPLDRSSRGRCNVGAPDLHYAFICFGSEA